jgi:hypothetical protein
MEMGYWPLYAADAVDLTRPYWEMVLRQLPDCRRAAQQRWGIQGAYYPETTPFDGPVILPEDVAQEYQDVYLGRKKNTDLSERARQGRVQNRGLAQADGVRVNQFDSAIVR